MELIFNNKDAKVYCFDLPVGGLSDNEMENLMERLPPPMQQRISAYKDRVDRQLRVFGKLMLQQLIKDFDLDKQINISQIQYNKDNKPFFSPDLFFSTSHAGNKVICAASKTKNLGVDIEIIKQRDLNEFINLLSDKELMTIQKSQNPLLTFYKCWTKKEALSKAIGEGVNMDFLIADSQVKKKSSNENELFIEGKSYIFYELPVTIDYVAMLVTADTQIEGR